MKIENYVRWVETFDLLISGMKKDLDAAQRTAIDPNKIDKQDLLYGLFGIVPVRYFLSNNGYHKAQDKRAYKEKCVSYVRSQLERPYRNDVGSHNITRLTAIVDGLCAGSLTLGQTHMVIPSQMKTNFEKNWKTYKDGKSILIEVLSYWKELFVTQEKIEEEKIERVPYTSQMASIYGPPADPIEEREWAHYELYGPDVDDFDDGGSDRFDYDDDGSNWSYNEEHD